MTEVSKKQFLTREEAQHTPEEIRIASLGHMTEIKSSEEKKRKTEAQTQEVQKMEAIKTLAGGIAHQFNNDLVGITGNIELLKMDHPDNHEIDKYIEPMKASVRRMSNLTNQLLAYARGGKYQPKVLSLSHFVAESSPLIQHSIDHGICIETDLAGDISHVEADFTQMQMVLSALLTNAQEAIEEEGVIQITTRDEEIDEDFARMYPGLEPGRYVCLTITDNGKGMDRETRNRVFEPFFTTKFQGRGLSMAAVYGIVENHDGWIWVDSELGRGTSVRIYLPSVEVKLQEFREQKSGTTKDKRNILVIEDEEMVMDVCRAMLERMGYRVLEAKTGAEAVRIAKNAYVGIDLAILDIVLPDMEGKVVYSLLREARPNLKVVVCSGYAIDGPAQDIMNAGAQDFIQKPFSLSMLSSKLEGVLEGV